MSMKRRGRRDGTRCAAAAACILFAVLMVQFGTETVKAQAAIAFVQSNSATPQAPQAVVTIPFTAAQTAGNLIVVVVGWNDSTAQVQSLADTQGNVYTKAIGPTAQAGVATQSIYYANNIAAAAANANTVTVTFTVPAAYPDIRIAEYRGIDPSNPFDIAAAAQGNSASSDSGAVTTTTANDLLVGANLVQTMTSGPGASYTSRVITSGDGDILEDRVVTATGSYSATAPVSSGPWIMQMVAFRAISGPPPTLTSLTPASGAVGLAVTIAGTNFGTSQGTSTVTFKGIAATIAPANWSASRIAAPVPGGATSGPVVVTVGGQASNSLTFTVTVPPPTSVSFVQRNSADPQTPQSTVTVAYVAAQTIGDLNVVVVGWNDSTAQVQSVTDTSGNTYVLAVGPTVQAGVATQAIYYAANIAAAAANSNTVTVTFTGAAQYPDIRIAEYSGIDPANPVDVAAAAQGSSSTSSSGAATTTDANDLIVGANMVQTSTTAAGSGFTSRAITNPDADILEDQVVTATGSYSATAPVSPAGQWIMQMVAFRAASVGTPPAISVTVSPTTATTPTANGTQTFLATVLNDPQGLGVTFSLSGSGCSGAACGALSNITPTSATYTAPATIPASPTVTLTATSTADATKTAAATITVTQGVLTLVLAPKRGAITTSQTQQFSATVTNDPLNGGVTWMVDGNSGGSLTTGTITPAGLFVPGTQPGLHTVTATSVSNPAVSTASTIAVTDLSGVFTHHNDTARTGQNLKEYALSPSTVSPSTFGLLFSCPVDGYTYAQPLYAANLNIAGAIQNVVFIATEGDSVYAFNADSPTCTQLWHTNFLGANVTTMSWQDTSYGGVATDDVFPQIGITSTPVIDPVTNTIYVVAKTKETVGTGCSPSAPCFVQRLHALDLLTGQEKLGGPIVITAPNFAPLRHMQRPALLLANGTIYLAFGSHGDLPSYQGWLFGYDATTLAQKFAVPVTYPVTGSAAGGIWGGGAGPALDAGGNVYVVTGNGAFNASQGNYGDSVLKFGPAGTLLDYFTPFDQSTLSANDIDLGSAGAIILPDSVGSAAHPHLALAMGKSGVLYLLDQTSLGQFHSGANQDVQEVTIGFNLTNIDGGLFGSAAYWNGNIYVAEVSDVLRQFTIANGVLSTASVSNSSTVFPLRAATPAVSANGTTGGVVWVLDLTGWQPPGAPAVLDAYDATNLATLLYSSPVSGTGAADIAVKFTVPTVANGKVYVGGQTVFSVFGLLP